MAYKQKKSMIAGTDPVKRAKETLKGYRDAFVKGYNHGGTAEMKNKREKEIIKKGYDSINKTKQVAKKRATTVGSTESLSGGFAKSVKKKPAPVKRIIDIPISGHQSYTWDSQDNNLSNITPPEVKKKKTKPKVRVASNEELKEGYKKDKKEKKAKKKAKRKESRKDWRKRTGNRIKEEAMSVGREALTGALTNALKPREKKIVNRTAGFNVKFGG